MATPEEIETALALVRSKLAALHNVTLQRDAAVRRRNVATGEVTALNTLIATARDEANAARVAAQALMQSPIS